MTMPIPSSTVAAETDQAARDTGIANRWARTPSSGWVLYSAANVATPAANRARTSRR